MSRGYDAYAGGFDGDFDGQSPMDSFFDPCRAPSAAPMGYFASAGGGGGPSGLSMAAAVPQAVAAPPAFGQGGCGAVCPPGPVGGQIVFCPTGLIGGGMPMPMVVAPQGAGMPVMPMAATMAMAPGQMFVPQVMATPAAYTQKAAAVAAARVPEPRGRAERPTAPQTKQPRPDFDMPRSAATEKPKKVLQQRRSSQDDGPEDELLAEQTGDCPAAIFIDLSCLREKRAS